MLEKCDVFNEVKNVGEEVLRSIAMYGARQRQTWLVEGHSKYPDLLGTRACYATYEAYAEGELLAFKMKQWHR
jgi:hypothetical protein